MSAAGDADNAPKAGTVKLTEMACEPVPATPITIVPLYVPGVSPAALMLAIRVAGVSPAVILIESQDPPLSVLAVAVKWMAAPPLVTVIACCVSPLPLNDCVKAIRVGLTVRMDGPLTTRLTGTTTGLLLAPDVMVTAPR